MGNIPEVKFRLFLLSIWIYSKGLSMWRGSTDQHSDLRNLEGRVSPCRGRVEGCHLPLRSQKSLCEIKSSVSGLVGSSMCWTPGPPPHTPSSSALQVSTWMCLRSDLQTMLQSIGAPESPAAYFRPSTSTVSSSPCTNQTVFDIDPWEVACSG